MTWIHNLCFELIWRVQLYWKDLGYTNGYKRPFTYFFFLCGAFLFGKHDLLMLSMVNPMCHYAMKIYWQILTPKDNLNRASISFSKYIARLFFLCYMHLIKNHVLQYLDEILHINMAAVLYCFYSQQCTWMLPGCYVLHLQNTMTQWSISKIDFHNISCNFMFRCVQCWCWLVKRKGKKRVLKHQPHLIMCLWATTNFRLILSFRTFWNLTFAFYLSIYSV